MNNIKFDSNLNECERLVLKAKIKSLIEIGLMITADAKLHCPVDTGFLRNSISQDNDENNVVIGTNTEYAETVELGSSKQRSQPYLYPAGVGNAGKIINVVKKNYGGI